MSFAPPESAADGAAPVRWGICGTGRIAEKFVAALERVPDARPVAVASRDETRAEAFARAHGLARRHGSWSAMAVDDDLDVVYVAVTQNDHLAAVLEMLRGGRHVLCEKPLAMSRPQAESMFREATLHDRFLMEAMWSRFSPAWTRLAEIVSEGAIGEPRRLDADLSLRVAPEDVSTHRLYDPARGGGALLDVGIYPLALSSLVFGPPRDVAASAVMAPTGVDEQVGVVLGHDHGAMSVLTASIGVTASRSARVSGTDGSIVVAAPMHASSILVLSAGDTETVIACDPPSLAHQVPEVHRCIRSGLIESPVLPWAESAARLGTADRVREIIGLRYPGEV